MQQSMQDELVSIITPLYNAERYVALTIESVLAQTYPHWEMIIINDGSRDGSERIAQSYAERDARIRVFTQANAGSAAARNNGIRRAEGRYIALLDADDVWEPYFLESQLSLLREKNCQLVYGAHRRIDEHGEECLRPFFPPERIDYHSMLRTCSISCLTALYDTVPYGKFYLHEEFRSLRDDYIYWLEIMHHCEVAYGNRRILGSYRILKTSATAGKWKMIWPQFRVYLEVEKLGWIRSCYYLCTWAIHGLIKHTK